jgi:hypothetical protein
MKYTEEFYVVHNNDSFYGNKNYTCSICCESMSNVFNIDPNKVKRIKVSLSKTKPVSKRWKLVKRRGWEMSIDNFKYGFHSRLYNYLIDEVFKGPIPDEFWIKVEPILKK